MCIGRGDEGSPGAPSRSRPKRPPEAVKRWRRKNRLKNYGLTPEQFDLLLKAQDYACGMCHEPFKDLSCNTSLGVIERKYAMAHAYLVRPPAQLLTRAA